jgi:hypothetical protein
MLFYIMILVLLGVLLFLINSDNLIKKQPNSRLKYNPKVEEEEQGQVQLRVEDAITTDNISLALENLQNKFFSDSRFRCDSGLECSPEEKKTIYTSCLGTDGNLVGEPMEGDIECPAGQTKSLSTCCQTNSCAIKPPCPEGYDEKMNSAGFMCCDKKTNYNGNLYGLGIKTDIDVEEAEKIAKDVGLSLLISPSTPKGLLTAARRFIPKTTQLIAEISRNIARKAINKLASGALKPRYIKKIVEVAARIGTKVGEQSAKAAIKASKTLAAAATKQATKQAAIQSAAASTAATGVGAPVGAAISVAGALLAVFDGITLGLDLLDLGGYGELEFKSTYEKQKKELDEQTREDLKNEGYPEPYEQIMGPLDALSEDQLTTVISEKYNAVFSSKYFQSIMKNVSDKSEGKTEDEILLLFDEELDKVSSEIQKQSYSEICKSVGGMLIGDDKCSYTKEECNGYEWPIPLNGADTDVSSLQFRRYVDGKCIAEGPDIRSACEEAGIPYDFETGICAMTEEYCLKKGADWRNNDCYIDDGQKALEFLLGETVTRGLKQVFDTKQYESCQENEKDDGYFCRKQLCKDGDGLELETCYPKPNDGYYGAGPYAWAKCPLDRDGGVFCTRDTYGRGPGNDPGIGDCPEGSTSNFFGDCMAKQVDREDGVNHSEPWGKSWDKSDGCSWNRHIEAGVCFRACPDGYFGRAYEKCWANGANSDGVVRKMTERGKKECGHWQESNGNGWCYDKCKEGYHGVGPFCTQDCPPNTHGETCTKNSYGRGDGYSPETTIRVKQRKVDYGKTDKYGVVALISTNN